MVHHICLTYCQFLILNSYPSHTTYDLLCYKSQPSNVPHWAQTSQAFLAMQCFEPWSKMEQRCVKNSLLLFCLILLQTQKHWAVWQNCNSESWFYLKGSLFVPTDGLIDIANCTKKEAQLDPWRWHNWIPGPSGTIGSLEQLDPWTLWHN